MFRSQFINGVPTDSNFGYYRRTACTGSGRRRHRAGSWGAKTRRRRGGGDLLDTIWGVVKKVAPIALPLLL
jgi:hypothetical protein